MNEERTWWWLQQTGGPRFGILIDHDKNHIIWQYRWQRLSCYYRVHFVSELWKITMSCPHWDHVESILSWNWTLVSRLSQFTIIGSHVVHFVSRLSHFTIIGSHVVYFVFRLSQFTIIGSHVAQFGIQFVMDFNKR